MPLKPELNVSGYRGIWGETLTEEIVRGYARAFALFTKEESKKEVATILIARDGRESGPQIKKLIISELENLEINVIDGDVMPTPTVLFSVRKHKYDGAIIITASHNPIEYNGLKFVNSQAFFTIKEEVEKIKKHYINYLQKNIDYGSIAQADGSSIEIRQQADIKSNVFLQNDLPKEHADQILNNINVEAIRARKFKVAVDMINASACVMDPYLFEKLGVELMSINDIPNGKFSHKPEPLIENLTDIANLVKKSNADIGFAHDPDADRLVVINEKGEAISEEYSLALGVENILSKNKNKTIVINLSTSQMSADIAKKYDSQCIRSKIGEGNVVEKMILHNAIIGGEGGGGVIYPKINIARDSFAGIGLILELLAERRQTVGECVATLPKYFMKKDKESIAGKDVNDMYIKLKSSFIEALPDEQDGLRLDFPDNSWIHLRPSNTEPIIRLIGEAKSEERINELFKQVADILK